MNAPDTPSAGQARTSPGWVSPWLLISYIAAVTYVLSYGPMLRLTCNVAYGPREEGKRQFRAAPFPALSPWTDVIYRPLLAVEEGKAGRLPQRVLGWYVNLWLFPRHA